MASKKQVLKIKPFGRRIQIQEIRPLGNFEVKDTIKLPDKWVVKAIGSDVKSVQVGDIVFLKGYAIEHVVDDDTGIRYSFTFEDDDFLLGICGNTKDA